MKKLKTQSGETLVETLAAILIISLIFLFLATAIVTGARINAKLRETDVSFQYEDSAETGDLMLDVRRSNGGSVEQYTVREYAASSDADGDPQYHYYKYQP